MSKKKKAKVVDLSTVAAMQDLSAPSALQIINDIVTKNSERIFFTHHAEEQMFDRSITRTQVIRCFTNGKVTEGPYKDIKGNWKLNLEALSAGDVITVVAALDTDDEGNFIVVITAF